MLRIPTLALAALSTLFLSADDAFARQSPAAVRVVDVTPLSDVPFGERFDLEVTLRVAPSVTLSLPDSVPDSPAVEASGRGVVRSVGPAPGDSLDVRVAYPSIAFLEGPAGLADLPVLVAPGGADDRVLIGEEGAPPLGAARIDLRLGTLMVAPLAALESGAGRSGPRTAADVYGRSWGMWDVSFLAIIAAGMIGLVPLLAPGRPPERREGRPSRGLGRPAALVELDRILGLGWHRQGRLAEFYTATTDVLRKWIFHEEPRWGPWLTSREVTRHLVDRWGGEASEEVSRTVRIAERVRFSEHRTTASAAEADWATIRDWIAGAAEADSGPDADPAGGGEVPL